MPVMTNCCAEQLADENIQYIIATLTSSDNPPCNNISVLSARQERQLAMIPSAHQALMERVMKQRSRGKGSREGRGSKGSG